MKRLVSGLVGVLTAMLSLGGIATAQVTASTSASPPVEYWVGDYQYSGRAIQNGGIGLSGNTLNFSTGTSQPINGAYQLRVWLGEDGVPRIASDQCTAALFPAQDESGADLQSGGRFVEDYAYAGSRSDCGKNPGDVDVEAWVDIVPTSEGLQLRGHLVRRIQQPYAGRIEAQGSGLLRPVYRRAAASAQIPNAPRAVVLEGLAATLDNVIRVDSRGWLMNQYDVGSVTNARMEESSRADRSGVLFGEYTYNGGRPGWVRVRIADGVAQCVEYWDFQGRCRAVGSASYASQLTMDFLVAAMTAPPPSGDYSPSSPRPMSANDEFISRQAGCREWVC